MCQTGPLFFISYIYREVYGFMSIILKYKYQYIPMFIEVLPDKIKLYLLNHIVVGLMSNFLTWTHIHIFVEPVIDFTRLRLTFTEKNIFSWYVCWLCWCLQLISSRSLGKFLRQWNIWLLPWNIVRHSERFTSCEKMPLNMSHKRQFIAERTQCFDRHSLLCFFLYE